jgi:hypothetical protein
MCWPAFCRRIVFQPEKKSWTRKEELDKHAEVLKQIKLLANPPAK